MSNQLEAGMPYEDIAASAYRAYANSTGNKNFRGEPMPEFNDLPQPIRVAWEAAIRQAENCFQNPRTAVECEANYAGWLPPQYRGK